MMAASLKFERLDRILVAVALLTGLAGAACPTMDLTGDCRVDLADFTALASQWLDEGIPDTVGLELVTIPTGTFEMGDNFAEGWNEERPVHTVTLGSFQMSKHEITNTQYAQFLNAAKAQGKLKEVSGYVYASTDSSNIQPWCDTYASDSYSQIVSSGGSYSVKTFDGQPQDNHPVVQVSWYGAQAFCDFYGYKLPTEAQWEYAARGGLSGQRFPWGDTITHNRANYYSHWADGQPYYLYDTNSSEGCHPDYNTGTEPYTAPVGSFAANGYGLCDMSGNVLEWCSDWYDASYYSSSPASNPSGPTSGSARVLRGGGWYDIATYCRVAIRHWYSPENRTKVIGFRVCRP